MKSRNPLNSKVLKEKFPEVYQEFFQDVKPWFQPQAQKLYEKAFKAKPEVILKDFFRGDELVMLARF